MQSVYQRNSCHDVETGSPVQPMVTCQRRVFLKSAMGLTGIISPIDMGEGTLVLEPRPSQS